MSSILRISSGKRKHIQIEANSSVQKYVAEYSTPVGWKEALTPDDSALENYLGLHHYYKGVKLDKNRESKLFAARDLILSSFIANEKGSHHQLSVEDQVAVMIIDIASDPIGCGADIPSAACEARTLIKAVME